MSIVDALPQLELFKRLHQSQLDTAPVDSGTRHQCAPLGKWRCSIEVMVEASMESSPAVGLPTPTSDCRSDEGELCQGL